VAQVCPSWTSEYGNYPLGDPQLQQYIGELLYKGESVSGRFICIAYFLTILEGQFKQAETHFLAAGNRDSARLLGEMMAKWLPVDGSIGDFAVRGVVPFVFHSKHISTTTF
jgi:hypothetical protein